MTDLTRESSGLLTLPVIPGVSTQVEMKDMIRNGELIPVKKKIPRLSYAYTDNGIELPVLDVTHPLFISSIDKEALEALRKNSTDRAKHLRDMPNFVKKFLGRRSFIMAGFFLRGQDENHLNGMSTLMCKLGPGLIGGGWNRFWDRVASKALNAVAMRMRLRDMSRLQADVLIPQLKNSPQKNLGFVNIAGGAASDSINTLILVQEEDPSVLKDRKIEINVLDIDAFGPHYAARCIESLKKPPGRFHGLDISFRHIEYNWNNTAKLVDLLSERREWILMCASEGGLFEYGTDAEIISNLNSLYENTADEMQMVGDVVLATDKVDPTVPAMMEASGIKARFLGTQGLRDILKRTSWTLDHTVEDNPTYVVFDLSKDGAT